MGVTTRRLADRGYRLQLAAPDPTRLEREARDTRLLTSIAMTGYPSNVLQDGHGLSLLDKPDLLLNMAMCAVGLPGDRAESQRSPIPAE